MAKVKLSDVDVHTDLESSSIVAPLGDEAYARQLAELLGQVTFLADLEDAPQGRHLGMFSTLVLFVSRILGSGFLAVSSGIYEDCGELPVLFFLAWLVAAILAFSGLYVYLELGSLIPRSGGTKVFLEFIYNRPLYLTSVVFSVYSILFGFTVLNILVFGEYFLHAIGVEPSEFRTRVAALVFLYFTALMHGLRVSNGVFVQNAFGVLKLVLASIVVLTGFWAAFLPTSVTHIEKQLTWDGFFVVNGFHSSKFASGVIKATFAFAGWNSVHTVSNEIKNPVRTFKIAGPLALAIITVTYIFINIAYLVVIPSDEIVPSGKLIGLVLFQKVFGKVVGKTLLTMSAALCAGGNVIVVLYTISRTSQEVFREGYLPFSQFMASNWPLDAPLPVIVLSCLISTSVLVLIPGKDLYNYVVSLESYLNNFFVGLTTIGIFVIRKRFPEVRAPIRSHWLSTSLVLIITAYLTLSPFLSHASPNPHDLESWPSYALVALVCLGLCALYWAMMFRVWPWLFNYSLVPEDVEQRDGLVVKKWVKINQ